MGFKVKINFEIAEQIRDAAKKGETIMALARKYDLSRTTISHICHYYTWTGKPHRRTGHKLDEDVAKLIIECKKQGFTYQEIVKRFNISWRTVHDVCTGKRWASKRARLSYLKAKQIRAEYDEGGTSIRKLAKKYGVVASAIAAVLNEKTWQAPSEAIQNFLDTQEEE